MAYKCTDCPSIFLNPELGIRFGKNSLLQLRSRVLEIKEVQECLSVTGQHLNGSSLRIHPIGSLHVDGTSNLWLAPRSSFCATGVHDPLPVKLMKETILLSGSCTWEEDSYYTVHQNERKCWTLIISDLLAKVKGFRHWNATSPWKCKSKFMVQFGHFFVADFHFFEYMYSSGTHCNISGKQCWALSGISFEMENRKGNAVWPTVYMPLKFWLFQSLSGAVAELPTSQAPKVASRGRFRGQRPSLPQVAEALPW